MLSHPRIIGLLAILLAAGAADHASAADTVTVDAAGVTTIWGDVPMASPTAGTVSIGGGVVNAAGTVTGANVVIGRTSAATGAEAVRGDDERLSSATQGFKGRISSGTGPVEDLTPAQATSLLSQMVGDAGSGGSKGLVPAPAAGDAAAGKFLRADGTWAVPASTVVHVEASSDAAQAVTASTTTPVLPASANLQYEDIAEGAAWFTGTVFTAPRGGVYLVRAGVGWTTSSAQYSGINIIKNGTRYVQGPRDGHSVTGVSWALETSSTLRLAAGDTIALQLYGNNLTRSTVPETNRLCITRIGD